MGHSHSATVAPCARVLDLKLNSGSHYHGARLARAHYHAIDNSAACTGSSDDSASGEIIRFFSFTDDGNVRFRTESLKDFGVMPRNEVPLWYCSLKSC